MIPRKVKEYSFTEFKAIVIEIFIEYTATTVFMLSEWLDACCTLYGKTTQHDTKCG